MNWTEDINFAATSLGLEKYSILGLSGGAPYALACAYRYPQRITGLTIVSGLAPLNEVVNSLPNKFLLKLLLAIANKSTWLIYPFVMTEARTVKLKPHSYKRRLSKLSGPDGELYTNPVFADIRTQVVLEASRAGIKGWVYEANLLTKSWGFNIDGITIPIHLWYGMQDTYIPFVMAEYLASSLTHCKTHFIEGEGHVSLLVNHGMDIIKSMFNLQ
jgi:pimeloyl-ACP methyl ester carboxylesterase